MALLTYLDASGSGVDPRAKVLTAGGFTAHEDDWARFENEWPSIMQRFGVTALHMKDYAHSVGEFASWKGNEVKRAAFMHEVAGLIKDSNLEPVGATIPMSLYRYFNREFCLEEKIGTAYTFAVVVAISKAMDWKARRQIAEPMLFFIEKGDNQQEDLRRYFARLIWDDSLVAEPVFMKKRRIDSDGDVHYVTPFQASDFVAYEFAKATTDLIVRKKSKARMSIREAVKPIEDLPDGIPPWALVDRHSFRRVVENFEVPRRFNHFRGSLSGRRPIAALSYVHNRPVISYIGTGGRPAGYLKISH